MVSAHSSQHQDNDSSTLDVYSQSHIFNEHRRVTSILGQVVNEETNANITLHNTPQKQIRTANTEVIEECTPKVEIMRMERMELKTAPVCETPFDKDSAK